MDKKVYLLIDYREHFYESTRSRGESIQINRLKKLFADSSLDLVIKHFHEVNFRKEDYNGAWVVYQSSEDRGQYYKDYIEDVLLGLQLQGARLIPDFYKFRAHHNKVFMEFYRDLACSEIGKTITSRGYGTLEEFKNDLLKTPGSLVMKPSAGALSAGVRLVEGDGEKLQHAAKLSRTVHWLDWIKNEVNKIRLKEYSPKSCHRKKFITQNLIPGLSGDYKILVYGEKYYVLYREIRKGDFRASGSGIFSYPEKTPFELLDFCQEVFYGFNAPFISLDVAEADGEFHLLEFQFLSFGNYTIEKSEHYYSHSTTGWKLVKEIPDLEREIAASLIFFIDRQSAE